MIAQQWLFETNLISEIRQQLAEFAQNNRVIFISPTSADCQIVICIEAKCEHNSWHNLCHTKCHNRILWLHSNQINKQNRAHRQMNAIQCDAQFQFAIHLCNKWWHLGYLLDNAWYAHGQTAKAILFEQLIADWWQIIQPNVLGRNDANGANYHTETK